MIKFLAVTEITGFTKRGGVDVPNFQEHLIPVQEIHDITEGEPITDESRRENFEEAVEFETSFIQLAGELDNWIQVEGSLDLLKRALVELSKPDVAVITVTGETADNFTA
jgi:hypothetical protein